MFLPNMHLPNDILGPGMIGVVLLFHSYRPHVCTACLESSGRGGITSSQSQHLQSVIILPVSLSAPPISNLCVPLVQSNFLQNLRQSFVSIHSPSNRVCRQLFVVRC